MLTRLKKEAGEDPDIIFWTENSNRMVGALMKTALGCVHVSTREGFGLVVTEALWQGTPVIGSRVGGIVKQVIDGQTGYLVNPLDEHDIASKMARLLENPEEAEKLGKTGQEHVRNHFLLPELVRRYLVLLRFYTGIDTHLPPFRLDGLSYSEILQAMKIKHPYLRETPNGKNK
jgi:trehalose synthase